MKLSVFSFTFVSAGALLLSGCDPRPSATPTTESSPSAPATAPVPADWVPDKNSNLIASPNPVPAPSGVGTTTISWSTGGRPTAAVYVSTDGGAEALFAEGSQSSSEAPWIQVGPSYEFRLYTGTDRKQLLQRVTVTATK